MRKIYDIVKAKRWFDRYEVIDQDGNVIALFHNEEDAVNHLAELEWKQDDKSKIAELFENALGYLSKKCEQGE